MTKRGDGTSAMVISTLTRYKEDMVRGLPVIKHVGQFCDTCVINKQRRAPFPARAQYRA